MNVASIPNPFVKLLIFALALPLLAATPLNPMPNVKLLPTAPVIPSYPNRPPPVLPKSFACPALTDAIAHVESSFGQRLSSPDGDYTGWHHMGRAAWKDVNEWRKQSGYNQFLYSDAMDYKISSFMCHNYLQYLERQFRELNQCDPTLEQLLACYNGGFHKCRLLKFDPKPFARYTGAVKKYIK